MVVGFWKSKDVLGHEVSRCSRFATRAEENISGCLRVFHAHNELFPLTVRTLLKHVDSVIHQRSTLDSFKPHTYFSTTAGDFISTNYELSVGFEKTNVDDRCGRCAGSK